MLNRMKRSHSVPNLSLDTNIQNVRKKSNSYQDFGVLMRPPPNPNKHQVYRKLIVTTEVLDYEKLDTKMQTTIYDLGYLQSR